MAAPRSLPLPLLITGVAGVAGYNALTYFQQKYPGQVIGIRQEDNWPLSGPGIEACNLWRSSSIATNFGQSSIAPEIVLSNLASSTRDWLGGLMSKGW